MNNKPHFVELAKYPIAIFSIALALILLKFVLGLEFGMVTELSTNGLKFSENSKKATVEALTEIEGKLSELTIRLESVERKVNPSDIAIKKISDSVFSASQTVSDATAGLAALSIDDGSEKDKKISGWIWIGDYRNKWKRTNLARLDTGQPIAMGPAKLQIGTEYKVLGNMVIRDGVPPNNGNYYRARKSIGVVPRGGVVSILSVPEGLDRGFTTQYWAEILYRAH